MKKAVLLQIFLLSGCHNSGQLRYEEIIARPSSDWSGEECFMVASIPVTYNVFDQNTSVKIFATPYYPSVILAIQRAAQKVNHWSEETFCANTDTLMADAAGMYVDWKQNRLVDSRGYYLRDKTQIDAIEFLITIDNIGWPCKLIQIPI